jgi:hypothetical protein
MNVCRKTTRVLNMKRAKVRAPRESRSAHGQGQLLTCKSSDAVFTPEEYTDLDREAKF